MRPDWDTYFLGIAAAVSVRGDCTRRQIGAVLVRPDNSVAGVGYNGAPRGEPGCLEGACPRGRFSHEEIPAGVSYDDVKCIALHAEMNCFASLKESSEGYTLYITDKPCYMCKLVIKAYRVSSVVWPDSELALGWNSWQL